MNNSGRTTHSQSKAEAQANSLEPREVALSQVESDTAGQQKRVHRQVVREGQEKAATPAEKRDTARHEALAREHRAELSEEGFNEAQAKVGEAQAKVGRRNRLASD